MAAEPIFASMQAVKDRYRQWPYGEILYTKGFSPAGVTLNQCTVNLFVPQPGDQVVTMVCYSYNVNDLDHVVRFLDQLQTEDMITQGGKQSNS